MLFLFRIIYRYLQIFKTEFFYPNFCLNCENQTNSHVFCDSCYKLIEFAGFGFFSNYPCFSLFFYNTIGHKVLMNIKYSHNIMLLEYCASLIDDRMKKYLEYGKTTEALLDQEEQFYSFALSCYDPHSILVPVPSTFLRLLKKKSYTTKNFCRILSSKVGIRYDCILSKRKTNTQGKKTTEKRYEQANNLYVLNEKSNKYGESTQIILVDDMITSGATLSSCIAAIKQRFSKVFVLTISNSYKFRKKV